MGGAQETFRREKWGGTGSLSWHPINQEFAKKIRDNQRRGGESSKVRNAARKKLQQKEFMQNLPKFQFDRAVGKLFNGTVSIEDIGDVAADIGYVRNHIGEYEREVETFITEKGTKVIVTIVDFTRSSSKPLQ